MSIVTMIRLALASMGNRAVSVALTMLAIAVSVALFVGVEKMREGTRAGFDNTVSGTDLIVGARTGAANLVLYTVFRIGEPTAEISFEGYRALAERDEVDWAVPIALGDSLQGFRVVGTTPDYFQFVRTGERKALEFRQGEAFDDVFEIVLGAEAARGLDATLGADKVLSHGLGQTSFAEHDNITFQVVGILAPTGTPIDQSVFVSLEGITAMHEGWVQGARTRIVDGLTEDMLRSLDLTPKTVTAVFVGLKNRTTLFNVQRAINTARGEPLSAVIPSLALQQLWQVVSVVERALALIAGFVVVVGVVSILIALLSSLRERRREMALLRAVGARSLDIFALLIAEAKLIAFIGGSLGIGVAYGLMAMIAPLVQARFGISLTLGAPGLFELITLLCVVALAAILTLLPAWSASRNALQSGLTIRI
jgi:putative ABC transport system permease protein